ncbi:MAG: hypothetical protein RIF32_18100, partial [Leptospirales bacterium]
MLFKRESALQDSEYILSGYEDLEISTQIVIRDALARGLDVEVLSRKAHWLRISRSNG